MTIQQYERFTDICKAIDFIFENSRTAKNQLFYENAIITISDKKKDCINIKVKKYKGKDNYKYIYDLIITQLKLLEAKNKKLDFDNKCDISMVFEPKPKKKRNIKNQSFNKKGDKNVWKQKRA